MFDYKKNSQKKFNLKRHLIEFHEVSNENLEKHLLQNLTINCSRCESAFTRRNQLFEHLLKKHDFQVNIKDVTFDSKTGKAYYI